MYMMSYLFLLTNILVRCNFLLLQSSRIFVIRVHLYRQMRYRVPKSIKWKYKDIHLRIEVKLVRFL